MGRSSDGKRNILWGWPYVPKRRLTQKDWRRTENSKQMNKFLGCASCGVSVISISWYLWKRVTTVYPATLISLYLTENENDQWTRSVHVPDMDESIRSSHKTRRNTNLQFILQILLNVSHFINRKMFLSGNKSSGYILKIQTGTYRLHLLSRTPCMYSM